MLKIENDIITAKINPFGAELSSLVKKDSSREYLWQADSTVWGRHAPILFPVVGRIAGDTFTHGGEQYFMQKHGFARNSNFDIISSSKTAVALRMTSDEITKKSFPFDFELDVYFSLDKNTLKQEYVVRNVGENKMYFSIGMHPGFFCKFGDIIRFEKNENAKLPYLNGSDTSADPNKFIELKNENTIVLTKELFEQGSLALEAPASSYAELCTPDGKAYLKETFGKIPMLWLWAKAGYEYVCIEPWFGSDERYPTTVLSEKKGIMSLDFAEEFRFPIEISLM
ncbi:MAG: aldose 1-epimerase family protein [Clostridia bacterium]|nr:aldose 1-epimerase family protein [Clostridia bacterium]